jgi:hypothetical protein
MGGPRAELSSSQNEASFQAVGPIEDGRKQIHLRGTESDLPA